VSVAGRNAIKGSTLTVYRGAKTPGTGGQTTTTWSAVLSNIKWELHTLTSDLVQQVFGMGSNVELVSFAEASANVLPQDGVVVSACTYTGTRYRVVKTRRSRKYLEIGLKSTTEAIP
jgi:hypothetical protein